MKNPLIEQFEKDNKSFEENYCRKHHRANTLVCGHLSNGVVEPWSAEAMKSIYVQSILNLTTKLIDELEGRNIIEKTVHTPSCQKGMDKNNHFFCSFTEREYGHNQALSAIISQLKKFKEFLEK